MNRSKFTTKVVAVLVGTIMISSLSGCSKSGESKLDGNNEKNGENTKITMLAIAAGSTWNNFPDSAIQKEIRDKTGVTLTIDEADAQKYNVMLASGELPDIIRADTTKFDQLIKGGNVIPLDDLLKSNGTNITKAIPQTLEFSKKFWSDGQNKTYFIPPQVGVDGVSNDQSFGAVVRWDYYKELGYPEIKNEDDLVNVIADMVKKHPTADGGKKTYGVSAFNDWGNWAYVFPMASIYGYQTVGTVEAYKVDTNEITSMMTDFNAPFWKTVSFYYKANKLGILDPDTLTQKYGDFQAKATSGQIVYGPATWTMGDFNTNNAKNEKGFEVLPLDWGYQWGGAVYNTGWSDKSFAITKNSKNSSKAMDLMNYLWSYEGCRTLNSGIKGVNWDIVNGKPKLKEDTVKMQVSGGDDWKNTGIGLDGNIFGLSPYTKDPDDGAPVNLFNTPDVYVSLLTPLQKDFSNHYGVKYPNEIFNKKLSEGKVKNQSGINGYATALMPTPSDDIKRIEAKLSDLSLKNASKCILSKSDAEFTANQQKALSELKAAGADTVAAWYKNAWDNAITQSKSIK